MIIHRWGPYTTSLLELERQPELNTSASRMIGELGVMEKINFIININFLNKLSFLYRASGADAE